MDLRKLKKLIDLVKESEIGELEVREGEESVRITRNVPGQTPVVMAQPYAMPQNMMPAAAAPAANAPAEAQPAKNTETPAANADKHTLKAPMVGTVYLSATPGSKPFVEIGQNVKAGEVICLIEAMKMFNQIEADKAGTVTARLVDNGTPVEFNQPLFVIE